MTLTWQHPSSCCLLLLVYNWLALSALDVFKQWWLMLFLGGLFTAANCVWAWSGAGPLAGERRAPVAAVRVCAW